MAADIRVAADDVKIGFNQVSLEIMPAWGGAERLAALVGRSQALLLAGSGTVLSAAEAHRIGLINRVVPRAEFDHEWRSLAQSLANRPAGSIKQVLAGATPGQAIAAFADLWTTVHEGRRWNGYVKNLRKDGGFYWVYATVIPKLRQGRPVGFTSVRREPSRAKVEGAEQLYESMRRAAPAEGGLG